MHRSRVATIVLAAATMLIGVSCGSSGTTASTSKPAALTSTSATTKKPTCGSSVPYVAGEGGYASYRIPAVITTGDGVVLAFAEGRRTGAADSGDIDTVLRRSTDGGCTWSPMKVVTSGKGQNRNNPAVVFDPQTKSVILLTLVRSDTATELQIRSGALPPGEGMQVFEQHSSDDGVSFSEPRNITDQVSRANWRWNVVGPGHGIVLQHGPHAGRIVFGANHSIAPPAGSAQDPMADSLLAAHAVYSDDHGRTWHIGFVQDNTDGVVNGNETTAAQIPDGDVYFSTRNQNGSAASHRADAVSSDGGATLVAPLRPQASLSSVPVIEASLLQLSGSPKAPLLLSSPSDPNARKAMTIFSSHDSGKTWAVAMKISDAPAAYSDLVQLDTGTVGLLYETGKASENETITFTRIPVADLEG